MSASNRQGAITHRETDSLRRTGRHQGQGPVGRGDEIRGPSYTMEFSHYDVVPGNVQQQIVSKSKMAADEDE
jgi:hypothetical protein